MLRVTLRWRILRLEKALRNLPGLKTMPLSTVQIVVMGLNDLGKRTVR